MVGAVISNRTELDTLASELCGVIDGVAAEFGTGAAPTIDGDLDCDPVHAGQSLCWQYGVRLAAPGGAEEALPEVVRSLEITGWGARDRSTPAEAIVQFSREGANVNIHIARETGDVTVIGSTRCVPGSTV
jgi:hypothetical protein